jgi:hypothetical protein
MNHQIHPLYGGNRILGIPQVSPKNLNLSPYLGCFPFIYTVQDIETAYPMTATQYFLNRSFADIPERTRNQYIHPVPFLIIPFKISVIP